MDERAYLDSVAERENVRRLAAYKLAVQGWVACSGQDYSLGLPPRPFPALPMKQAVVEVDGEPAIVESFEPVCGSALQWGPDGQTIITPLPARRPSTPFRVGA